MNNIYIVISMLSNLILFQSVAKKNNKNLNLIMYIMFTMKIINIMIADKYDIDNDKLMITNFIFGMLYISNIIKR